MRKGTVAPVRWRPNRKMGLQQTPYFEHPGLLKTIREKLYDLSDHGLSSAMPDASRVSLQALL
jgi:hypothetical protein